MSTPPIEIPSGLEPSICVPMKLPSILLSLTTGVTSGGRRLRLLMWTLSKLLPEMMFRAPAVVPYIVLLGAPSTISTPLKVLPKSMVPVTSVPMKFLSMTFPPFVSIRIS